MVSTFQSPDGLLTLETTADTLVSVSFGGGTRWAPGTYDDSHGAHVVAETRAQLEAYFDGRLRDFDLPLAPAGTAFQQSVWRLLIQIPYGTTTTYGALATTLGDPGKSRAVGAANGRNPIAIIIPCHRVIGANGSLTGFAGGLDVKRRLLDREAALLGHSRLTQGGLFDDTFGTKEETSLNP
jgi:methylated-DNA-[protein]-cysteine S-methyltransferase